MLNRELIAKEYDYLNDVVYLNTSLVSMPPKRVQEAWKKYIDGYVDVFALNYGTYFEEKLVKARKELAKLLKVDTEEVGFTHSTADSMTLLAESFPFQAGDNVIISSEEHASNAVPWLGLKRLGVNVKMAKSKDGAVTVEDVLALVDDRTRVIAISGTFFCSGYAIDLKALGEACQERHITLAVDGTQCLGRLAIFPRELHIDFMGSGSHKGLLGTKSMGIMYCSKELAAKLKPYTGSLQNVVNGGRPFQLEDYDDIQWAEGALKLESGNYPFALVEALGNGVSFINELGIENIDKEIRNMEAILRDKLKGLPMKLLTPPVKNQSGMLFTFYPKTADPAKVEEILWNYRIRAKVRFDYIRMTLDFYNTPEQMDRVAQCLFEIAKL